MVMIIISENLQRKNMSHNKKLSDLYFYRDKNNIDINLKQ